MAYRKSYGRKTYSRSYRSAKTRSAPKRSAAPQTLRIVIEQQPTGTVSRYPGIAAKMTPAKRRSRL